MRRRAVLWLVFASVFFASVYLVRIREDMVDFQVNYRAAERLRAGETLYQTGDGHFMFKYFPASAILYLPLTALPIEGAKAVWYALTVVTTIVLFVLSWKIVSGAARRPWYVLALPPLVLAKFCFRELNLGQINTVVTLALLIMLLRLLDDRRPHRDLRAGAWWGVATALKPYGFIFFPYFVLTRNLRALASGAVVLSAAFVLPAVFYGLDENIDVHREWYATLSASTPAQLGVADNLSIVGALTKWTGDPSLAGPLALVAVAILAFIVLAVILHGRDLERSEVLEVAVLLTLIPLVSPLGWDYQLLTSVLAVTLLADRFAALPARWLLGSSFAVIGLSIYDLIGRTTYRAFMHASVLTVCFLVVVGYLVYLRARRLA